jgi:hypothetical protein
MSRLVGFWSGRHIHRKRSGNDVLKEMVSF